MPINQLPNIQRRAFLKRLRQLSVSGVAAPWAMNLAAVGEAAAFTANDYKALVCIFLYGGNDCGNTIVPVDTVNYAKYASIRVGIATSQSALAATTLNPITPLADGMQFALAPELVALKPIFDAGKLAVQLNVGPLIVPTTLAQYKARSVPLPPKLFSHNDQQSTWQASLPEGAISGWGGRIGDLALASGTNSNAAFTCISVTGNAVYVAGQNAVPYQVSTSGAVAVTGVKGALFGSETCSSALRTLMTQNSAHLLENEHAKIAMRSIGSEAQVSGALAGVSAFTASYPANNSLASQLQVVAKLIAARNTLNVKRQVFMVSLGGFDLHDNLPTQHPVLLTRVAQAMAAFYNTTVELGISDKVTAFTASDFGRTLASNGDGSDHGWGSHHFVMGGAVKGRQFYGKPPAVAVSGPDDVGSGRLLPTTSVDQFAATLASWFGVADSELTLVVPNIRNFSTKNIGFV